MGCGIGYILQRWNGAYGIVRFNHVVIQFCGVRDIGGILRRESDSRSMVRVRYTSQDGDWWVECRIIIEGDTILTALFKSISSFECEVSEARLEIPKWSDRLDSLELSRGLLLTFGGRFGKSLGCVDMPSGSTACESRRILALVGTSVYASSSSIVGLRELVDTLILGLLTTLNTLYFFLNSKTGCFSFSWWCCI